MILKLFLWHSIILFIKCICLTDVYKIPYEIMVFILESEISMNNIIRFQTNLGMHKRKIDFLGRKRVHI